MDFPDEKKLFFQQYILNWYTENPRPLPWKQTKNPYLIWLSEIILQQTRVEQGTPYYNKFAEQYPSVKDLADAPEDEVMKLWEGLGYYSRARNLHATAKHIAYDLGGEFPNMHAEILKLKGVGPYTAAAISSFAFDLPNAVVDGNVYRVLARFFGIDTPIDTTAGKKLFAKLAQACLHEKKAGAYNQAIMNFGALQCSPKNPDCTTCPLTDKCTALHDNTIALLPIKSKKLKKRDRHFHYLIINEGQEVLLNKRTQKDIWQQLYEFPLIELETSEKDKNTIKKSALWQKLFGENEVIITKISKPYRQTLSHQKIIAHFWEIEAKVSAPQFLRINRAAIRQYAFPKVIDWYLQDKSLTLELF